MKNNDYKFIKNFIKISVPKICKENKIDRSNLINGRTTAENYKKVKECIENEIEKLY